MTSSLDQRSAARILDLAESRGSRSSALMGFALILLFAAHAALAGGFPRSAQAAAMSPAGVRIHARESAQMKRLMAISAAAIVTAGASAQNAVQWRVEDGGNGNWYALSPAAVPVSRTAFIAAATAAGAHPVMLSSKTEELFVYAQFGQVVLGLSALPGSSAFTWMADPSNGYSNWGTGACPSGPYPNNSTTNERFAQLQSASCPGTQGIATKWDDYQLGEWPSSIRILLEWSADCNNDGIVDYGQILAGELADLNHNNVPDCCENGSSCCPGDTNNDGFVDGIDLATILTRWAQPATKFPNADCNRDGVIDGSDLSIVLGSWGVCP